LKSADIAILRLTEPDLTKVQAPVGKKGTQQKTRPNKIGKMLLHPS
jgi:hypothetical protein